MNTLLVLPVLIPFINAIILVLLWNHRIVQRTLSVIGGGALLLAGLALLIATWGGNIHATQLGSWPAPFGITFVADTLSAIMVFITGLMGLLTILYSLYTIDVPRESAGYHPLLHGLLMGVSGAFLTGDVFNMYVWYEVMLIASFVLMALGGERGQLEGAIKYVALNLVASTFFLGATGLLYGTAGSLNMADLALRLPHIEQPGMVTILAMLYLVAFGIKAALFPLFFWLPASYHTPPIPVTIIFSALLTKVGVYSLIRVFTLLFVQNMAFTHTIILVIAGFTMVTGVLGAVAQMEVRRLLSFHIISQIGYLLMGLGLSASADAQAASLALAGTVFFMAHVILAKSALFLVSGILYRVSGTYDLKQLGGFYVAMPALAAMFLISALSLAGIPPLSGFWAKFALVRAGLQAEQYLIVGIALAVSILTLFSMVKIWAEAFWKKAPYREPISHEQIQQALPSPVVTLTLVLPVALIATLMIVMGLWAGPLFALSEQAASQLLNTDAYIQAVCNNGGCFSAMQ